MFLSADASSLWRRDDPPAGAAPGGPPGGAVPQFPPNLPHDSAGTKLNASVWALFGVGSIFLTLRLYCKYVGRRGLFWDDRMLIVVWCLMIANCSLASYLVSLGFGLHTWDFPFENFGRLILFLQIRATISITALAWSKTAFAITLLRLTDGWMKKLLWFVIISMNMALGVSALLRWVSCTPIHDLWDAPYGTANCVSGHTLISYDMASGAYSAAMDLLLALLPWKIIWKLKMGRIERIGATIAMSMGVVACITSIVKTVKLLELLTGDLYDGVQLVIWDIAETCVTVMAASIPVLRVLIRDSIKSKTSGSVPTMPTLNTFRSRKSQPNWPGSAQQSKHDSKNERKDDQSDKSILGYQSSGAIVLSTELEIISHSRTSDDSRDLASRPKTQKHG